MFEVSKLLVGHVEHRRVTPNFHRLRYKVFSLLLDLDNLERADRASFLFSINKWNALSLHTKDMADGQSDNLARFVREMMAERLPELQFTSVWLQTYPRVFGYVFNPLSVYFCLDGERIVAAIYEVSNTFGGRIHYVQKVTDLGVEPVQKSMVVSPFNPANGKYGFSLKADNEEICIGVALKQNKRPVLKTWFRAKPVALTSYQMVKLLFGIPLMTAKVIIAIHYEALKLWLKGLRTPRQLEKLGRFTPKLETLEKNERA